MKFYSSNSDGIFFNFLRLDTFHLQMVQSNSTRLSNIFCPDMTGGGGEFLVKALVLIFFMVEKKLLIILSSSVI